MLAHETKKRLARYNPLWWLHVPLTLRVRNANHGAARFMPTETSHTPRKRLGQVSNLPYGRCVLYAAKPVQLRTRPNSRANVVGSGTATPVTAKPLRSVTVKLA